MHVCMCACEHVCMFACVHLCMCACEPTSMRACVHVCVCAPPYVHFRKCAGTCTYARVQLHTHAWVCGFHCGPSVNGPRHTHNCMHLFVLMLWHLCNFICTPELVHLCECPNAHVLCTCLNECVTCVCLLWVDATWVCNMCRTSDCCAYLFVSACL